MEGYRHWEDREKRYTGGLENPPSVHTINIKFFFIWTEASRETCLFFLCYSDFDFCTDNGHQIQKLTRGVSPLADMSHSGQLANVLSWIIPGISWRLGNHPWWHESLLILLKVNRYLPARVPARRARFPKGAAESGGVLYRHRRTVRWIEYARHTAHTQSTVSQTHVSARPQYHDDGTRPDTTTFLCWISALLVTFSCEIPIRLSGGSLWWQPDAASLEGLSLTLVHSHRCWEWQCQIQSSSLN